MKTDLLVKRLLQKRDVLSQLHQLANCQAQVVRAGEIGRVMELLAGKQRLVMALQAVEAGLDPFRDEDPEARVWRTPADREAARKLAAECSRILDEVTAMEQDVYADAIGREGVPGATPATPRSHGTASVSRARAAYHDRSLQVSCSLDMSSDA